MAMHMFAQLVERTIGCRKKLISFLKKDLYTECNYMSDAKSITSEIKI